MEKWAAENDKALFYKFDVDELPNIAQELSISAMPTFTFFDEKDGTKQKVGEVVGAKIPDLISTIQTLTGVAHTTKL